MAIMLGSWVSGIFDTPAASGGYRSGSSPDLVGENGPEIFNPGTSGTITPNRESAAKAIKEAREVVSKTR
ncbi:MAG: hypothetical protein H6Q00_1652 [Holophagaceae bacterium]|nr:hypothetical protein [Holophagaceae bacterium]